MTVYGDTDAWITLFYDTDTIVGDTNTNTTIDDLNSGEIAKCRIGMTISGTDIPTGTTITAVGSTSITISAAATGTTNDVTFTIPNALCINCEDWDYGKDDTSAINIDYPNRGHFGFTMNSEKVIIKIKNAYVLTEAAWNILKAQLEAAEEEDTCEVMIQVSSTPTYELYSGIAGENRMPIIILSKKGYKKPYKGDSTLYKIGMIQLRQSGALA